jgi:hypothetical protein
MPLVGAAQATRSSAAAIQNVAAPPPDGAQCRLVPPPGPRFKTRPGRTVDPGQRSRWALPVIGTNRTGAMTSRVKPFSVRVIRTRSWSPRPTGATRRPPTLS